MKNTHEEVAEIERLGMDVAGELQIQELSESHLGQVAGGSGDPILYK